MESKLSKIFYSPQGYWKGLAAVKKLSTVFFFFFCNLFYLFLLHITLLTKHWVQYMHYAYYNTYLHLQ